jgi:broad specificity phosphatase PhoE
MGESMADLYLRDEQFQGRHVRIYSSQHCRISQSSNAISRALTAPVVFGQYIDEDLRQLDYGSFDGICREAKQNLDPVVYGKLHSSDMYERYTTETPGGESSQQLEMRLHRFLRRLRDEICEHEDVLIINHGPHCRILEAILTHSDPVSASESQNFGTGDLVKIKTDLIRPGLAQILHMGKQRSDHIDKDFKTEAVVTSDDGWRPTKICDDRKL